MFSVEQKQMYKLKQIGLLENTQLFVNIILLLHHLSNKSIRKIRCVVAITFFLPDHWFGS